MTRHSGSRGVRASHKFWTVVLLVAVIGALAPAAAQAAETLKAETTLSPPFPTPVSTAQVPGSVTFGNTYSTITQVCYEFFFSGDFLDPGENLSISNFGGFTNVSTEPQENRTLCSQQADVLEGYLDGTEDFSLSMDEGDTVTIGSLIVSITGEPSSAIGYRLAVSGLNSVTAGDTLSLSADVTDAGDVEPLSVTVMANSLIPGTDPSITNPTGTPTYTATISIPTSPSTPPGLYWVVVSADGGGFRRSVGHAVQVFAAPENQPPDAVDDSASTAVNTPVNIDVLANDSDPDEDDFFISNVSEPGNGSAFVDEDGTISYTPFEGFTGTDTFTYTISDGELEDEATVTVTVTSSENEPPVAVDDQASTAENTSVNIDVLANDSDPDEDTVFVSDVSQPENGSTFINKDQTISYTPNEGFTGVDTFTYTASDFESTDTATVMVLVGDDGDSCEVEASEGCTATTDSGVTGADNPVSVTMTVPPGQPAGVYAIREIDQTVPEPAGAFEYIAPADATEIFIEVSCDESQCPRLRNRRLDLELTVIKENPDGTVKTLLPCVQGRRGQIVNPPPCVFSVVRDIPGSGDLIWTVKVLGEDPKAGGAR